MSRVTVWRLNDCLCDGNPGDNRYYKTEEEARADFNDPIWQELSGFEAVEVGGIIYFEPKEISFE